MRAISAANYNYNHYNLPFSNIMIIVLISNEDIESPLVFWQNGGGRPKLTLIFFNSCMLNIESIT